MYTQRNVLVLLLFLTLSLASRGVAEYSLERLNGAIEEATETYAAFLDIFTSCARSPVPGQQFKIDNIKGFINYPSRTTVGSAPKVTSNRKFFANLVSTRSFKEMLDKDVDAIRANYIKKMKYCKNIIMNQNTVRDFYDREVDQTKI